MTEARRIRGTRTGVCSPDMTPCSGHANSAVEHQNVVEALGRIAQAASPAIWPSKGIGMCSGRRERRIARGRKARRGSLDARGRRLTQYRQVHDELRSLRRSRTFRLDPPAVHGDDP